MLRDFAGDLPAAIDKAVAEKSEEPLVRIAEVLLVGERGERQLTAHVARQNQQLDMLLQTRAALEMELSQAKQDFCKRAEEMLPRLIFGDCRADALAFPPA